MVDDIDLSSIRCLPHGHISKTKQDLPIVAMEHYYDVDMTDSVVAFRSSRWCCLIFLLQRFNVISENLVKIVWWHWKYHDLKNKKIKMDISWMFLAMLEGTRLKSGLTSWFRQSWPYAGSIERRGSSKIPSFPFPFPLPFPHPSLFLPSPSFLLLSFLAPPFPFFPIPPEKNTTNGFGGALWAPPAGSGAEPQPKLIFVHICCKNLPSGEDNFP